MFLLQCKTEDWGKVHNLVGYIHKWRTEMETVPASPNQITQNNGDEPISEVRTFENIPQGAPKVGHPKM